LKSGVLASPADAMLREAIATTLAAEPTSRAQVFERLVREIELFMSKQIHERPWTCRTFFGTDGSRVFRGGVGHSLVIDTSGRLWRARSYEDFATTYVEVGGIYEIDTLAPIYEQMREYRQPAFR
jgi:hypothetical protein